MYGHHLVHQVPSMYLSHIWKFLPFQHFPPICIPLPRSSGDHESFCFFVLWLLGSFLFVFRFYTSVRQYNICFLWLFPLSLIPSSFIHVIANGRTFSLFMAEYYSVYIHIYIPRIYNVHSWICKYSWIYNSWIIFMNISIHEYIVYIHGMYML